MSNKLNFGLFFTFLSVRARTYVAVLVKRMIGLISRDQTQTTRIYRQIYDFQRMVTKAKRTVFFHTRFSDQPETSFYTSPRTHSSSILVLAAGLQTRWQENGHKQLAVIQGKPLIKHTLDKTTNALVITHHEKLQIYPHAVPSKHYFILETLLSTQALWKQQTVILLGDVFFGKQDLQKVLEFKGEFAVFGSKSQVEIFALSFSSRSHAQIKKHLHIALSDAYQGGRGKLWEFYHSFAGLPLFKIGFGEYFIELSHTTDVDTIEDYDNLQKGLQPKQYLINHLS
jgi:hypothetical protein